MTIPDDAMPKVALRDWLEASDDELIADFDRLFVPRNEARWLRRNALIAAGNVGSDELAQNVERYLGDDDPVLRETAGWALSRIAERSA